MTNKPLERPPIHTAVTELVGWTLDRSANIPKSHRFSFGQRLDNITLDALMLVTQTIYAARSKKAGLLGDLNLLLEQLRVLWRLIHARHWISQQQLLFVNQRIDEIGRMTGGWLRQLDARPSKP